jgi:hypothetical protein
MSLRYVLMLLGAFVVFGNDVYAGNLNHSENIISDIDARLYIGHTKTVCGDVKRVNLKKYGAFIDMGGFTKLPNGRVVLSPSFTAIIWENDRIRLKVNPKAEFLGEPVCFSGVISSSPINRYTTRAIPQITIRDLNQIKIKPIK